MPNVMDFFIFPIFPLVVTILILSWRYRLSKDQFMTGMTDKQRVSSTYWGVYEGTQQSVHDSIHLPQFDGHLHCTGCNLHEDPDRHHLAK